MLFILLFILLILTSSTNSLNILFYVPTLSHSHVAFNSKLATTLSSAGHSVTILLAQVDDSLTLQNDTSYTIIQKKVGVPPGHLRQVLWNNPGPYEDSNPLNPQIFYKLLKVSSLFVSACENIANDRLFMEELRQQKFDIGLVEQYDSCGFGVFNAIGINSTVWLSATAIYRPQSEALGVYLPYSYVPELFAHFNEKMTLIQKVVNILIGSVTSIILELFVQSRQSSIFGIDLAVLSSQSSSLLINSVPFFDYSMPMSHQFSNIGGFTVDMDGQTLDTFWKSIADDATDGFILVSFGGIARTIDMSESMQKIFFSSFSQFPDITFIVKYESNSINMTYPDNVILTPWIPQLPLMAHQNYKSIITHGGWSSILETVIHSKPMILMPLFADHAKNSKVAESKGVAVLLDKMSLTKSKVVSAIRRVLTEKTYSEKCEKISRMFSDVPISHDKLVDWRIRQASKESRKRFAKHLIPKEPNMFWWKLSFFMLPGVVFLYRNK